MKISKIAILAGGAYLVSKLMKKKAVEKMQNATENKGALQVSKTPQYTPNAVPVVTPITPVTPQFPILRQNPVVPSFTIPERGMNLNKNITTSHVYLPDAAPLAGCKKR